MKPATRPLQKRSDAKLLAIDRYTGELQDSGFTHLPQLLRPGDLLIVNDAATLPGSLGALAGDGAKLELRLVGPADDLRWRAVLFGPGSWREDTESREPPPLLKTGDSLDVGCGVRAMIVDVSKQSPRLVEVTFNRNGADLWGALYAAGAPVQYSHIEDDLTLWSVQTVYGARPWAAEMPSAGRPLTWSILHALRASGVEVAWLTHAAGLSATGDPDLDRLLPLPERYEIPEETADAVERAISCGARIIAVGTTVVRALEGNAAASGGRVRAGSGETDLIIDFSHELRVVDGVISGMHAPKESHYQLLRAFADEQTLVAAWRHAVRRGYRCHEFGDATLVLCDLSRQRTWARAKRL